MYVLCGRSASAPDRWCYITGIQERWLDNEHVIGRDTATARGFDNKKQAEKYKQQLIEMFKLGLLCSKSGKMTLERLQALEVITVEEAYQRCSSSRPFRVI